MATSSSPASVAGAPYHCSSTETIPAVVRTANEQEQLELALVENIQRSDLNALDEARAYRHLIDEFGLTQERVAERVGRSRPTVANTLRILETAPAVQQAVADGAISGGHARALAGLESHAEQEVVLATVVARSLSVRQTEGLVQASHATDGSRRRHAEVAVDPDHPAHGGPDARGAGHEGDHRLRPQGRAHHHHLV